MSEILLKVLPADAFTGDAAVGEVTVWEDWVVNLRAGLELSGASGQAVASLTKQKRSLGEAQALHKPQEIPAENKLLHALLQRGTGGTAKAVLEATSREYGRDGVVAFAALQERFGTGQDEVLALGQVMDFPWGAYAGKLEQGVNEFLKAAARTRQLTDEMRLLMIIRGVDSMHYSQLASQLKVMLKGTTLKTLTETIAQ